MAAAVEKALDNLTREVDDLLEVKLPEWPRVEANELVGLLRTIGGARKLIMSGGDFTAIDLGPKNLDQLGCPRHLRSRTRPRGIEFSDARLEAACLNKAQLQGAHLEGADLSRAQLQGADLTDADLDYADLGNADLEGAILLGASLRHAKLSGANLRGVRFHRAKLEHVNFQDADLRDVDLRSAKSLHNARWHNARLEKTGFYPYQIEPIQDEIDAQVGNIEAGYRAAMEAYLALKSNFTSLGTYGAAAWAYMKEQQLRKSLYFPTTAGKRWLVETLDEEPPPHWWNCSAHAIGYRLRSSWLHVRLFFGRVPPDVRIEMHNDLSRWRCARNWMYELLTGYGERPQMPVVWGLVTILGFFVVYWAFGNVTPDGWLNALTHSIAAFATIGFNTLEPVGWGARLLTAVESMLGISLFALFIYTLGNRMSRS